MAILLDKDALLSRRDPGPNSAAAEVEAFLLQGKEKEGQTLAWVESWLDRAAHMPAAHGCSVGFSVDGH